MTTNSNEPRQSVLDGLQLYELIDLTLLDKLINSKLLKETFNNKICSNILKTRKNNLKYKALFKRGITASSSINEQGKPIRAEQPRARAGTA
jgi:hypothetical protein